MSTKTPKQSALSCDNISEAHDNIIIAEDANAMRVICRICKEQNVIRKDWRGSPEKRQYAEIFKRDILQGNDNLLYKYRPDFLKR